MFRLDSILLYLCGVNRTVRHVTCRFVQQDLVGERNLFDGFVLHPLGLLLVQVLAEVRGVRDGQDGVEIQLFFQLVVDEEGLRLLCKVSQHRLDSTQTQTVQNKII